MKRFAALLLLAGCTTGIEAVTPESVTIGYDAPIDRVKLMRLAAEGCAGMGKAVGVETADVSIRPDLALSPNFGRRLSTWSCV